MIRYVHTNIVANDWKALASFYINVFNCIPIKPERKLSGQWLEEGTGVKNAALEGAHLKLPGYDKDGPTLEIFQYSSNIKSEIAPANQSGLRHLAFEVDDLNKVKDIAVEHGASMVRKTGKQKIGSRTVEFLYLNDPEGNIIELQKWTS